MRSCVPAPDRTGSEDIQRHASRLDTDLSGKCEAASISRSLLPGSSSRVPQHLGYFFFDIDDDLGPPQTLRQPLVVPAQLRILPQ